MYPTTWLHERRSCSSFAINGYILGFLFLSITEQQNGSCCAHKSAGTRHKGVCGWSFPRRSRSSAAWTTSTPAVNAWRTRARLSARARRRADGGHFLLPSSRMLECGVVLWSCVLGEQLLMINDGGRKLFISLSLSLSLAPSLFLSFFLLPPHLSASPSLSLHPELQLLLSEQVHAAYKKRACASCRASTATPRETDVQAARKNVQFERRAPSTRTPWASDGVRGARACRCTS